MFKADSELEISSSPFELDKDFENSSKEKKDVCTYSLEANDSNSEEEAIDDEKLEDDLKELPVEVRETVSFTDDPSAPTLTFRYFLMTLIFVPRAPSLIL